MDLLEHLVYLIDESIEGRDGLVIESFNIVKGKATLNIIDSYPVFFYNFYELEHYIKTNY